MRTDVYIYTAAPHFPSFLEGLSLRPREDGAGYGAGGHFPFFSGAFIEVIGTGRSSRIHLNFPPFLEGLSLRPHRFYLLLLTLSRISSLSSGDFH